MSGLNFSSLGHFAKHLEGLVEHTARKGGDLHQGLERAAEVVEHAAKEKFGHYQTGWPELADTTQEERVYLGFAANDPLKRTGELQESVTHDIEGDTAIIGVKGVTIGDGSEANPTRDAGDVMIDMELGTRSIPPRPVLGPAAQESEERVREIIEGAITRMLVRNS